MHENHLSTQDPVVRESNQGGTPPDLAGSGLPLAKYRGLAMDQIRLIAAQQLWLGSTDWPLQLDFYIGSF